MHILVLGATRGIGLETVKYGLERGHRMRAFARSADRLGIDDESLEPWPGDATVPRDLGRAVAGMDAVVMALGAPKTARMILRPVTLFSRATEALLPAMREAGVRRLLAVTGFGAGRSRARVSTLERAGLDLILGRAYADKSRQEEMIEASGLDWTIVRPGLLTANRRTGRYKVLVTPESWRSGVISRADVAHFLIHATEDRSHVNEDPVLVR